MATILVADDDARMRLLVRHACERMQHAVVEAQDGPSAVLAYQRSNPDLVILDLGMPGGGGAFVLSSLRFGGARTIAPVLVITGLIEQSADEIRKSLAVERVLPKPFTIGDLMGAVTELLRRVGRRAPPPPPPRGTEPGIP